MKVLLLLFLFIPTITSAFCFEQAEREFGISKALLMAIAEVESNYIPHAVNWNKNGTYDYGLMQINSSWFRVLGHEKWNYLADPCYNVRVAAWILSLCMKDFGYSWKAVGCYHSRDPARQKWYIDRVKSVINKYTGK